MMKEFLKRQADYRIEGSLANKMRKKRMKVFNSYFEEVILKNNSKPKKVLQILDIGGVPDFWKFLGLKYSEYVSITSLNVEICCVPDELKGIIKSVRGNASDMREFEGKAFDLAFSNSVIEHVGGFDNQKKMADEMRRVALHGFLQTPNKYFFIEPHFLFPFFQFFSKSVRTELVYRFHIGNFPPPKTRDEARRIVESIDLLSISQLRKLFPNVKIHREKWFGMTKSFILMW